MCYYKGALSILPTTDHTTHHTHVVGWRRSAVSHTRQLQLTRLVSGRWRRCDLAVSMLCWRETSTFLSRSHHAKVGACLPRPMTPTLLPMALTLAPRHARWPHGPRHAKVDVSRACLVWLAFAVSFAYVAFQCVHFLGAPSALSACPFCTFCVRTFRVCVPFCVCPFCVCALSACGVCACAPLIDNHVTTLLPADSH